MAKEKKNIKLIPPDIKRCQCLKPNGNTFLTFGGIPGYDRCSNKPLVIVTERKASLGNVKGSMSLCGSCWAVFVKEHDKDFATAKPIV